MTQKTMKLMSRMSEAERAEIEREMAEFEALAAEIEALVNPESEDAKALRLALGMGREEFADWVAAN